jgi:TraG P-loop domain
MPIVHWIQAVGVPCQLLARSIHYDRSTVTQAYEDHSVMINTQLGHLERELAGEVASQTMVVEHYVIFQPGLAGRDGFPNRRKFTTTLENVDTHMSEAERILQSAVRLASNFGIEIDVPDVDTVSAFLRDSVLAAREATACAGVVTVNDTHRMYGVVTALPAKIASGSIVQAMLRSRVRGKVSLHVLPVDVAVARTKLNRMRQAYRYAGRHNSNVDIQMMAEDAEALIGALAARQVSAVRIAVQFEVESASISDCRASMERLVASLASEGLRAVTVTTPGFVAACGCAPGGIPLRRSLVMTTDGVTACLLPVVGTPFGDHTQPLVGINASTGSPVYVDVFSRPNHNAVVVGTSGAGKSVTCKTMLLRQYASGARCIVIDPDSEYQYVMQAIGGAYVELGEASLNVLAVPYDVGPDDAAGLAVPVLSVMGGEEVGYKDGRPVRRLSEADKAWLHEEVAQFYADWRRQQGRTEPVISDLVDYLEQVSLSRCTSTRMQDRCRDLILRLRGYTQGIRARIFNRPTNFALEGPAIGVGLRELALQFRSDMTAAIAVVLTKILATLSQQEGRLIILVDEAHRVIGDPDTGTVLDQLVRQARKYGAGVWMASQSVDDFIRTDLGRILAATSATKLILGIEQTVAEGAQDVFGLTDQEMAALTPTFIAGRGVLISGAERAIVDVLPGGHLMPLVSTSLPVAV